MSFTATPISSAQIGNGGREKKGDATGVSHKHDHIDMRGRRGIGCIDSHDRTGALF